MPTNNDIASQTAVASKSRRRLLRAGVIAVVAAGLVAAGAGAAAATAFFTEETVERAMPDGAVIFAGTDPSCTTTDHVVFDCTLARAPKSGTLPANGNFTNVTELLVSEQGYVVGGCKGVEAAGLHWICYTNERAVSEGVIAKDMLGQHVDGPTVG